MEDRQTDDPPFCVARKIPYFSSIHIGGTMHYKEASARGIIIPLQSLGPASRQGILAKTWSTLNLGTSQNSSSRDCLETPSGLHYVLPRACIKGRKGTLLGASRSRQTRDPTRPATFQTVSPRTRVDRAIMWVPLRAAKGGGLRVCPCERVVRTPGAPR
jgi:hypothetical protein